MHSIKKIIPRGKNGKMLFYGALLLIGAFFIGHILKIFSKIFGTVTNLLSGETELSLQQNEAAEKKMDDESRRFDFSGLQYPRSVYDQIADSQFSAMQYVGTDFNSLINGVKGLSKNELLAVYYCYGLRQISTFGITDSIKKNLLQAYADELTSYSLFGKSELQQMQEIWDKTGFKI